MIWSSSQLYEWIAGVFRISTDSAEQWVWGGLLLGFLFATVHLVTMLITRWGDHHVSSKSLIFSVLVHLFSGAGVLAFAPGSVREQFALKSAGDPIRIHEVHYAREWEPHSSGKTHGDSAAWESVRWSDSPAISRVVRDAVVLEQPVVPERTREVPVPIPVSPLLTEFPQLNPERPVETDQPEPEQVASTEKLIGNPASLALEQVNLPVMSGPVVVAGAQPGVQAVRSPAMRETAAPEELQRELAPREELATTDLQNILTELLPTRTPQPAELPAAPEPMLSAELESAAVLERQQAETSLAAPSLAELLSMGENAGETADRPESGERPAGNQGTQRSARQGEDTSKIASMPLRSQSGLSGGSPADRLVQPVEIAMAPAAGSGKGEDLIERPQMAVLPSPLAIAAPEFNIITEDRNKALPEIYQLRDPVARQQIAHVFGGTQESEAAVERSLTWLASIQEPEGYWDGAIQFDTGRGNMYEAGLFCQNAGIKEDAGLTGLTVLAFLGAGYTHESGKYAETVRKALNWLIRIQRQDGYMGGKANCYPGMFYHGMATCALVEAYGMQPNRDPNSRLGQAVIKAINFSLRLQRKEDGSWSHMHHLSGDMSMFGWHLMAIKSAENAGLGIPQNAQKLMVKFLVDRSLGKKQGLAAYHPDSRPQISSSMTAEALFCKQMFGMKRDHESSQEAAAYLLTEQNLPQKSYPNLYYWYFGTLAMYQVGGEEWNTWNSKLQELLVNTQVKEGPMAGSWNPDGHWNGNGGRTYSTALAALSLEVYYRYLPLHRLSQ